MKNLTIAARISAGFLALTILIAVISLFAVVGIGNMSAKVDVIIQNQVVFYEHVSELRNALGNLRRFEKDYFINIADSKARGEYMDKWKAAQAKATAEIAAAATLQVEPEQTDRIKGMTDLLGKYANGIAQVSGKIESGSITTTADANKALSEFKENVHAMENQMAKIAEESSKDIAALPDDLHGTSMEVRGLLLTLAAVSLGLAVVLSFIIIRSIRGPLMSMSETSELLARDRDLNLTVPEFGNNELGRVARSLRSMIDAVRSVIRDSHRHSANVLQSANQLNGVSQQVAKASRSQTEATTASAAAIEEMTVSINIVADSARGVEELAQEASREASKGSELAERAKTEISQIAQSIASTSQVMEQLNLRSDEIGNIVQVIHDIAEQTNLLALNAAIEAARAGETGRGFAVVADEVRKLAERTSQATAEISSRIKAVQGDTHSANQSMQQANTLIDRGVDSARDVADALEAIRGKTAGAVERISEISSALKEQSQASQDIAINVEQISRMNQDTLEAVQQASGLATALHALAEDLNTTLNHFKA